jgi:hypothetical protein
VDGGLYPTGLIIPTLLAGHDRETLQAELAVRIQQVMMPDLRAHRRWAIGRVREQNAGAGATI